MSNPQAETVVLSKRRCRYCGKPYTVPKGERRHACSECAPSLYDALAEVEREPVAPADGLPDVTDGIPF